MEIKFPSQEEPFRKTLITAILSAVAALLVGLFLGYCLGSLFGTNQSMVNTTNYTDNMAAVKNIFMDADQTDSFMVTAEKFRTMDGLKVYSSRNREDTLVWYDGKYQKAEDLFEEDVIKSLRELMNTEEALYGVTDSLDEQMEGVYTFNIAVRDAVVYYYLYYDAAGYIGIAYDDTETVLGFDDNYEMPLTVNSEEHQGMWYLLYYVED